MTAKRSGKLLDEVGLAFMFAPNHHPAMKHAAGPRREMKLRTVFNLIGPLTNPAGAERQLIGVYAPSLVSKMASSLRRLGCKRGVVAHGMLGLDEVSPIGATKVAIIEGRSVTERVMQAKDFGIKPPKISEIACSGGIKEAVMRFRAAVSDIESPEARAILPSAGVAIWLGDRAPSIRDGVAVAKEAIGSGAAAKKLKELARRSKA
jgi:anthranilate phosphoribosyltransferase